MELLSESTVGMTVGLSEYCRILSDKPVGLSDRGSGEIQHAGWMQGVVAGRGGACSNGIDELEGQNKDKCGSHRCRVCGDTKPKANRRVNVGALHLQVCCRSSGVASWECDAFIGIV